MPDQSPVYFVFPNMLDAMEAQKRIWVYDDNLGISRTSFSGRFDKFGCLLYLSADQLARQEHVISFLRQNFEGKFTIQKNKPELV